MSDDLLPDLARALAAEANECCHRSDGWEEHLAERFERMLREAGVTTKPKEQPIMRYRWTCPHCGRDNVGFGHVSVFAEKNYEHTESVFGYCYPDDGGCDREVVLRVTTVSTATAHRIGGE